MRGIAEMVAAHYGLTLRQLMESSRSKTITHPRQEAMALMYSTGRWSLPQIGRYFDRDHTTVLHARRAVARRMAALDVREAA